MSLRAPVTGRLTIALDSAAAASSPALTAVAARFQLTRAAAVFRGHEDWAIDDWSSTLPGFDGASVATQLQKVPGVKWAEADQVFSQPEPAAAAAPPQPQPATGTGTARTLPNSTAYQPAPALPSATGPVAPPTTCTGAGGLNAGHPNDPLYCSEPTGPFYSEEWNNFCFTPPSQSTSVTAAAIAPPAASGICADGAWANGYQGQGTVIAILDSGIDYYHPDLVNQMVDKTSDPLLDPALHPSDPFLTHGTASDGNLHGWNFYDDTAEPMDYFGHGTGRAGIAAAQADNGIGLAGVAPKAHLMAVKVGDTYVVSSHNLAQGAVYAADHGADVINTSLGSVGASKTLATAALYAYSKGVVWAAATANEYSDHHNYPNTDTTVLGIGGLGPDNAANLAETCTVSATGVATSCTPESNTQKTFLQKVNYANFGGGVAFAAPIDTASTSYSVSGCNKSPLVDPPTGCKGQGKYSMHNSGTSTSTPHAAGAASLVQSAALLNGLCSGHLTVGATFPTCTGTPLSSNEVRQLLAYTATRVHNSDFPTSNNYPASAGVPLNPGGPYYPAINPDPHTGWNQWYGYGRPNAYAAALYAATAGHIPPEAQMFGDVTPPTAPFSGLHGPSWFGTYDPSTTPTLPIVGHVAAPRLGATQTYNYAVEVAPCLEPVDADFTRIGGVDRQTAAVDGLLATWTLPVAPRTCADTSADRAFNFAGTYTVRVRTTLADLAGTALIVSDPTGGPAAHLVGEDRRTLFVRHDTHAHPGWPKFLGTSGETSPTMYDLEGRGELDIIEPTSDGQVLAFRPDGTPVPGWPVSIGALNLPTTEPVGGVLPKSQLVSAVAVGDLDGDGRPEVVANALKGGVYAWHNDGSPVAGFPVIVPPQTNGPAFDPANYCTTSHPHLQEAPPDDPLKYKFTDYGSISSPVLGNLEGRTDGGTDIIQAAGNGCVYVIKPDGNQLSGWPVHPNATGSNFLKIASTPAVGRLAGPTTPLDVVVGTEEVSSTGTGMTFGRIYAYDNTGHLLTGWPVSPASVSASGVPTVATGVISSPALVDAAGDGTLKVADGVFLGGTDASHPVNLYSADGSVFTTLKTTVQGAGGTETDPSNAFGFGVTQTVAGTVGGTLSVVSGGLSPALIADTVAAPGKKPQFQHLVGAWNAANGNPINTFPRQIEDWQFLSGPVIADVKGDGSHQVITGSGGYMLHAFDPAAVAPTVSNLSTSLSSYMDYPEPAGFPMFTGGYITSTPAVGQLTRGGPVSVAVVTRDGFMFMDDTAGQPAANDQWWHFHHDEWNSGRYGLDTRPPATINDLTGVAGSGSATLSWTAPGDDWWVGKADHYVLRCSPQPLTYANFSAAPQFVLPGTPKASGGTEHATVSGANPGPYYCGIRSFDKAGNKSQLAFTTIDIPNRGVVMDGWGGLHPYGVQSLNTAGASSWPNWDIARGVALKSDASGGYQLDGWGGLHAFGTATPRNASGYWPNWDIARGIALCGDGASGYTLDGYGGIHSFGGATPISDGSHAYWSGWDIARGIVVKPDCSGGYTLDGWGGVHNFGSASPQTSSGYWPNWDIARGIVLRADGQSGYTLDGYGGVHGFGGVADPGTSAYWQGWDIANGLALAPDGQSGYVLDGWGGVHPFGGALSVTTTGYWPNWDIARGISGG